MKILVYSHFYFPEVGAGSVRTRYFVQALRNAGNEVKVITPMPNYPNGKKYEGYNKFFFYDKNNNVTYLPIFIPKKHSLIGRGLTYFSYFFSSLFYALFDGFKPDVILTSSPPITTTLAAVLLAKLKRKPIVVDIRDLWPDIGIELGIIKNKLLIKTLKFVDRFIIKSSDQIIVPLESFEEIMLRKGARCEVTTIYNGADTSVFVPLKKDKKVEVRGKYNLPQNKKIAVYFGFFNFGMNDVDTLAEALSLLRQDGNKFYFLFIGDGVKKADFVQKIEGKIEYKFLKPMSSRELSEVIASCDLSIIPLKKVEGSTGGFIPVKCLESWSAGLPVLLATDNDEKISGIFNVAKAGKIIPPSVSALMALEIKNMLERNDLTELGLNGREFVVNNFDRVKQSEKLAEILGKF